MSIQEQTVERILRLSDEGAAFINQVLNTMNPVFFINQDKTAKVEEQPALSRRIGIAKGLSFCSDDYDIDMEDAEINEMFEL